MAKKVTTTLRGRKTVYAKSAGTFEPFSWLGKCSRMGGTEMPKGDINVTYRQGDYTGEFERDQQYRSAPGPTTGTLMMKETIRNQIYDELHRCEHHFDIRTQLCGLRGDPSNWDLIKRFCESNATSVSADDETAYTQDDEGETVISMPFSTLDEWVIIWRNIVGQRVEEMDFTQYYISRVTRCHEHLCADVCDPERECKLIGTAVADTPTNPPAYAVSEDGGRSWTIDTIGVFTTATTLTDIACFGDLIIAVAAGEPGYAVSKDGGASWALVDDGNVPAFAIYNPQVVTILNYDTILLGGDGGYLWKLSNGGLTVEAVEEGVVTGGRITRIYWASENVIYAVGESNTGKKSINGGDTWAAMTMSAAKAGSTVAAVLAMTEEIVLVGYEDGGVYYSTNGGASFTRDTSIDATYPVNDMDSCGCDVVWLTGGDGAEGIIYRSVDMGFPGYWQTVAIDDPGTEYQDIVCCGPNHAVATGSPSGVYGAGVITLVE